MHKIQLRPKTSWKDQPGIAMEVCSVQLGRKEVLEIRESGPCP